MAMLTFLVTIVVLSASIYIGYRYSMRLYLRSAQANRSARARDMTYPDVRQSNEAALIQVRDYGLHYARTGVWICTGLMVAIVVLVIAFVLSVL